MIAMPTLLEFLTSFLPGGGRPRHVRAPDTSTGPAPRSPAGECRPALRVIRGGK
jgi:hypothetical protein